VISLTFFIENSPVFSQATKWVGTYLYAAPEQIDNRETNSKVLALFNGAEGDFGTPERELSYTLITR